MPPGSTLPFFGRNDDDGLLSFSRDHLRPLREDTVDHLAEPGFSIRYSPFRVMNWWLTSHDNHYGHQEGAPQPYAVNRSTGYCGEAHDNPRISWWTRPYRSRTPT